MPTNLFNDFISLFFPSYCESCHNNLVKGESLICMSCWSQLPETNFHNDPENELFMRFAGKLPLQHALAYLRFTKSGKVQAILHSLKYENKPELGVVMGKRYGELVKMLLADTIDLIIPVPLHESRLRKRGYNQSDAFAEGLSQSTGIPWSNTAVMRLIKSESHIRKTREERWNNVDGIFQIVDIDAVENKRILLVDDVVTTGATLESCAKAILEKAENISIATIAMA